MDVEKIVREYIGKTVHLSLATVSGDKPWVCEVHFAYDDNLNLYFRSSQSRRHSQEIATNPNVAGNIVRQHSLGEDPHAVYFEGTAKMLNTAEECQQALPAFQKCLGKDESILEDAAAEDGHKIYKITVENWYAFGAFDGQSSDKYQLEWQGGQK